MSRSSRFVVIVASAFAGFLGGVFGSFGKAGAASQTVIRASRFELSNAAGATRAVWEVGKKDEVHLLFFTNRSQGVIDIGLSPEGRPMIQMRGHDGKSRLDLELDELDKPMLLMSDERWERRVRLGFLEPDQVSPDWDKWGLLFSAFGSDRALAGIGVNSIRGSAPKGFIDVLGKQPVGYP